MVLRLSKLCFGYEGKNLVGPIEAEFTCGRLNLVVGRSGSGKSTLLKVLSGFHKNYSGAILFENEPFEPLGKVALVFQNPESVFFNDSVFKEIAFPLYENNEKEELIKEQVYEWMNKWGLKPEEFENKNPFELSGGEKRRVALAACTILKPNIILLDEPLAGLDLDGQRDLARIILSLSEKQIIVVVTHEPEVLMRATSSILFLNADNRTMSSQEFLRRALEEPEFYPIPEWYREAVSSFSRGCDLPMVLPMEVAEFIKRENK